MNPLLAKIREQLPNETSPFGLLVRGEMLEGRSAAFIQLAQATKERTRKEPGNRLYSFFLSAKDPAEYVLLERWETFTALARHFETAHFERFAHRRAIRSPEKDFRSKCFWRSDLSSHSSLGRE